MVKKGTDTRLEWKKAAESIASRKWEEGSLAASVISMRRGRQVIDSHWALQILKYWWGSPVLANRDQAWISVNEVVTFLLHRLLQLETSGGMT
jgi:hypothetical protein